MHVGWRLVLAAVLFAFAVNFGVAGHWFSGFWLWLASVIVPFITVRPRQGWVIAIIVATGFIASFGASGLPLDFNPDFGGSPDLGSVGELIVWIIGVIVWLLASISWGWIFILGVVAAVIIRRTAPR